MGAQDIDIQGLVKGYREYFILAGADPDLALFMAKTTLEPDSISGLTAEEEEYWLERLDQFHRSIKGDG